MKALLKSKVKVLLFVITLAILIPGYVQADIIRVEAWIDGTSQLHIQGNTAQWHHFDYSAPGLEGGNFPTIINYLAWFPTWPGSPYNCSGCVSSVFTGVNPSLNAVDQTVGLNIIQARDSVSIVQQPAAANNYTLIVEFDDNGPGGADWYIIELDAPFTTRATAVPTINEWGMILFISLAGLVAVHFLRREGISEK
jgi:hypothetical protein